jgi:diaminohydroxyphosphoribosylaminopyrimidine deaminase / 5-amino-6-(5-phosphoribosylamino)uracil reductase
VEAAMMKRLLDRAARAAWRGFGLVEPNPMVGCVIADAATGEVLGVGHHRRYGERHAEPEAIEDARRRGHGERLRRGGRGGAVMLVTLEPCGTRGKQPACVEAVLEAGIGHVVIARRDPHPSKGGGAEKLRAAGVKVEFTEVSAEAVRLADGFVHRLATGRPWTIAKWAQTIDGKVATRTGESQWISNERARAAVHRLRGRVDAIVTGIGTVLADDPLLTARGVRVRRVARRVVIDPRGEMRAESRLVRSAREGGPAVTVVTTEAGRERAAKLSGDGSGVEVWVSASGGDGRMVLRDVFARLHAERGVATVLVEAGAGLMGGLLAEDLVDEVRVFTGPMLLGDAAAMGPIAGPARERLSGAAAMELVRVRRLGDDVDGLWRRKAR